MDNNSVNLEATEKKIERKKTIKSVPYGRKSDQIAHEFERKKRKFKFVVLLNWCFMVLHGDW